MQAQFAGPAFAAICLSAAWLLSRRHRLRARARRVLEPLNDLSTRLVLLPQNWLTTRSERGQSMVEYALVTAVVSMVTVITLRNVGNHLKSVFTSVAARLHS